jgi:hypothetical protein
VRGGESSISPSTRREGEGERERVGRRSRARGQQPSQHTTTREEREKESGEEGREAAGAAAEARSIRSGSRNQVASVDRAHPSI